MDHSVRQSRRCLAVVIALGLSFAAACDGAGGSGPDPFRPQYYQLQFIDNRSLPFLILQGLRKEDHTDIDSAVLIPFAVGRTLDQRLLNDRTGRGPSGGNTRDTTVARGQFMDIRTLKHVTKDMPDRYDRDSSLVDVEVRDTVVIIRRPTTLFQTQIDTGYFDGDVLVVPTVLR